MGFAAMDARMDARIGRFRASMDNTLMRQTLLDMKCPWMPDWHREARIAQLK
jgi:hypothetical protein